MIDHRFCKVDPKETARFANARRQITCLELKLLDFICDCGCDERL